ncbi:MAG: hypothetical protein ACFBSC_19895 [Microcoleaceae cyanobacterium]
MTKPTLQLKPKPTQPQSETPQAAEESEPTPIFQGIGVIRGLITTDEEDKLSINVQGKSYPILPAQGFGKAIWALRRHLENNSEKPISLLVYPKVIHFPDREKLPIILFQVKGFQNAEDNNSIFDELRPGEFKLRGFWQFIPVYRFPVISVLRNYDRDRIAELKEIRQDDPVKAKKFSQAQHIPLMWRDAPVKPFRFNPKLDKEQQGERYFVQVKARFISSKDAWGFDSLLGVPIVEAPRFMKPFKPKAKKSERKPNSKSLDSKPQDAKPQEAKPQDAKPQDTKPQDTKHQETKHQDTKHQENKYKD